MSHMGDPNKHKSVRSISNCISSLYECIQILISVNVIRLLQLCICILSMFPTKRKAQHGFLICVGTEEEDSDLLHSTGPAH